jgi:hypothetical protein
VAVPQITGVFPPHQAIKTGNGRKKHGEPPSSGALRRYALASMFGSAQITGRDRPFPRDRDPRTTRLLRGDRRTFMPSTPQNAALAAFRAFAWILRGPAPHGRQRKTSLFDTSPYAADSDEEAHSVVALSRVPRSAGFTGSPPAAGPFPAVDRPLVQIPAKPDTTGARSTIQGDISLFNLQGGWVVADGNP